MIEYLQKKLSDHSGHTLVEVMVALICSSIVIFGLAGVYAYGIKEFNAATSRLQMFNEGNLRLRQIESMIRRAGSIYIIENNDPNRTELHLTLPYDSNGGVVEFFTNRRDQTLRMNDWRIGENHANFRLLPIQIYRNNNQSTARFPYHVEKMHFQYGDNQVDGYDNNASEYLVRIDLVLQDSLGNTVSLSSTQSRLN